MIEMEIERRNEGCRIGKDERVNDKGKRIDKRLEREIEWKEKEELGIGKKIKIELIESLMIEKWSNKKDVNEGIIKCLGKNEEIGLGIIKEKESIRIKDEEGI